jgi:hypothetical protein
LKDWKARTLKHNLVGYWSRRINQEHRIIYEVIDENNINILSIISLKVITNKQENMLSIKILHASIGDKEILKG